jgi:ribonuclease P protein component
MITALGSEKKYRFERSERLKKRREFLLVQGRGKKIHLRDLLAFVYPRESGLRLGITASKKVGTAVVRNRVKRRIRELWRLNKHEFSEGYDVVILARKTARDATFQALRSQVEELGRKMSHGAR